MPSYETYYDCNSSEQFLQLINSCCKLDEQKNIKKIADERKLQESVIFTLQFNASVNQNPELKKEAISWINKIASALKILPESNYKYYLDKSKGNNQFITTPAINLRMLSFHTARAALQSQINLKNNHVIFELALSERDYTDQKMDEFSALVKAAYISMGLKKIKFYIQGDHYQVDPKKYSENSEKEMQRIKDLIKEAICNDVYNIDIDTSKFETDNPAKSDRENQYMNAKLTAELLFFIRKLENKMKLPCTISVGGEVGEVGGTNTKYPQVNAYLAMIKEMLEEHIKNYTTTSEEKLEIKKLEIEKVKGLSKISINVGSAHGGQLGPDGKPLPDVPLDFAAHHDVYMNGDDPLAQRKHVLSVQHGASTLPKHYFPLFPAMHVAEIHLATGFQNLTWNVLEKHNPLLYNKMRSAVFEKYSKQISEHKNEAIGFAKECKRVTKFFKRDLLLMDSQVLNQLEKELQQEFSEIMHSLYTLLLPKGNNAAKGDKAD